MCGQDGYCPSSRLTVGAVALTRSHLGRVAANTGGKQADLKKSNNNRIQSTKSFFFSFFLFGEVCWRAMKMGPSLIIPMPASYPHRNETRNLITSPHCVCVCVGHAQFVAFTLNPRTSDRNKLLFATAPMPNAIPFSSVHQMCRERRPCAVP